MSADPPQPLPAQADPAAKQKKNPIGSWFVKKFGRRNSEAGGANPHPPTSPKLKEPRSRRTSNFAPANNNSSGLSANPNGGGPQRTVDGLPSFAGDSGQGLASTLVVPTSPSATNVATPPPQLASLPQQEPLGALGFNPNDSNATAPLAHGQTQPAPAINTQPLSLQVDPSLHSVSSPVSDIMTPRANTNALHAHSQHGSSTDAPASSAVADAGTHLVPAASQQESLRSSSDSDQSSRDGLGRDSIGNRTMDTGKSRASTKPTTLMSLDTREAQVLPTTHIAQARHGESGSAAPGTNGTAGAATAVQFASPPLARTGSGTRPNGAVSDEHGPYVNIPSHSRHHPSNNPSPFAMPPDNASVLTLASSTAAHSFAGAASSRSRRADRPMPTHAAMYAPGTGASVYAGPGAPSDRVSIHRTPSQRTVATQRSIPLSASASNAALNAYSNPKSDHSQEAPAAVQAQDGGAAAVAALHREPQVTAQADAPVKAAGTATGNGDAATEALPATQAPTEAAEPAATATAMAASTKPLPSPSADLLEAQAAHLAATEHDVPSALAKPRADPLDAAADDSADGDKLLLPGGPAISP
ncbi:uncharacterized protein PFL1_06295 [Pseudozyma flocculosa PF-1]|uniref:Uncharacterized protein n=1 Tax=Pseudozyma flocculosa PF-1 TaxID=1277687 RepID=A0A061H0Y3_9BASI|nr:uncharacterized protein PFL1_06295 [Pseudozyma flocculosa PF-1]EPQ26087.1 hypothetical protein PFL1_06295 [Pseudozyma flocculosa PF-1]